MSKLWIVTNGKDNTTVLALFSTEWRAEAYRQLLVDRFSAGRKLKAFGKPPAEHAGWWDLGIDGPKVVQAEMDANVESLPGAWVVRVDEASRMISCRFSTEKRVGRNAQVSQDSDRISCEAFGATPHDALAAATKGMAEFRNGTGQRRRKSWR